ncbi:tropomyosin-1-like [Branchiostoma floridae x Branchiostoma japonicum]
MDGGKLVKLKAKLNEISSAIDDADARKADAKAGMIEASSRLEKAESEGNSIKRRIALLGKEVADVNGRNEALSAKIEEQMNSSTGIEGARRELEELEVEGDERTQMMEDELRHVRMMKEETVTMIRAAEQRAVVMKREVEKTKITRETLEKRAAVLEANIKQEKEEAVMWEETLIQIQRELEDMECK